MLRDLVRHPVRSIALIIGRIRDIPSKGLPRFRPRVDDGFDRKYGVETSKMVRIVAANSPNVAHGNRYEAASEASICWSIENSGLPFEKTTFVDVGCGKGRALVIAATRPFKAIVGIEYARDLVKICRKNLEKVGAESRCEVVAGDAADYQFPDGDLLAFFYNPFDQAVHLRVLENLSKTKGSVRIAHLGPGQQVIRDWGQATEIAVGPDGVRLYEVR